MSARARPLFWCAAGAAAGACTPPSTPRLPPPSAGRRPPGRGQGLGAAAAAGRGRTGWRRAWTRARPDRRARAEIVVLDDGSTDGTGRAGPSPDRRRPAGRLVSGAAPAGLAGQAARLPAARRRTPTRPPTSWSSSTPTWCSRRTRSPPPSTCCGQRLDLVSPYPRQVAVTAGRAPGAAAAAVVVAHLSAAAAGRALAAAVAGRRQRAVPGRPAGRRTRRAGGHAAVRDEVLEDVALLRAVKRSGGTGGVADGTALADCRMYDGWAELRDGYAKSLWAAFGSPAGARRGAGAARLLRAAAAAALAGSPARARRVRRRRRRPGGLRPAHRRPGLAGRARPSRVGHGARLADRALLRGTAPRRKGCTLEGAATMAAETPPATAASGMSSVVVVGAGVGGLAVAARLAAGGHRVTICERADEVGGKLGRYERTTAGRRFRFDTGPSLLTHAAGLRRSVPGDRRAAGVRARPAPARPDRAIPLPRRHRRSTAAPSRPSSAARLDDALGGGAGSQGLAPVATGRPGSGRPPARPFLESALDGPADLARLAGGVGDLSRRSPRGGRCAGSAGRTWTTRGCGCCWTGTPPTPARTPGERRPHWPPCRTRSCRSAAGTCGVACAGSPTRCWTAAPNSA